MGRFTLEIENWTEYELVKDFSSFDRAKRYGVERFAQNNWRVCDRSADTIVYEHDPFEVIQREASGELNRFHQNEKWRRVFAERRADEVRNRQERERMAERNARRRVQQVSADTQVDMMIGSWWNEQYERENPVTEKVNWIKEGF